MLLLNSYARTAFGEAVVHKGAKTFTEGAGSGELLLIHGGDFLVK